MLYLRIKKKKDFLKILKTGKRCRSESLTVVCLPAEHTSMAVCVGKKYGKSVCRNRLKRLLRAAFSAYAREITSPRAFLLLPHEAEKYEYAAFYRDIGKILQREHLIER